MPELIESPSRVEAAGTKPKLIDEYAGRVNNAGQAVLARAGEWVRYSTPDGAVCLPAFSPDTVHRDES